MNAYELAQISSARKARGQGLKCASIVISILMVAAIDLLFLQQAAAIVS